MTKYWFIFVFVISLRSDLCGSNRALRKLNSKFNLLKQTVERDITDLRYEVSDLQTELEFERSRTVALEALLNSSSDVSAQGDVQSVSSLKKRLRQQDDVITKLKEDVDGMKKGTSELQKLKDVTENQERDLAETNEAIKELTVQVAELRASYQDYSRNFSLIENVVEEIGDGLENTVMKSLAVIAKAFGAEKEQLRELLKALAEQNPKQNNVEIKSIVESLLNSSVLEAVNDINQSCEAARTQIVDLETNLGGVMEQLEAESKRIASNELKLKALNNSFKVLYTTTPTTVKPTSLTTVNPTTLAPIQNYTVYALFGEDIAKNIRIGSRVIRGKNWAWGDQDGGGPGTVTGWLSNNKEVYVKWDAGRRVNYRVGLLGLYDLYIITGGSDQHLAGGKILRFKPIFKVDLERAIRIGSRVIRGEDWKWKNQDGGGPGTVTAWYQERETSKQVIVDWDRGTTAIYRVGAGGKYDLFLLADD